MLWMEVLAVVVTELLLMEISEASVVSCQSDCSFRYFEGVAWLVYGDL